jgi:hypothetical protein
MVTDTLQAALTKAAELPKEAQDEIAREVFERMDSITRVRSALEVGLRQLDAGEGKPLETTTVISSLHKEHGLGR